MTLPRNVRAIRALSAVRGTRPEEKEWKGKVLDYTEGFPPIEPRSMESRGRDGLAKVGWEVEQAKKLRYDREV